MRKISMFRVQNKIQEILQYNFSDIIKSNRLLLFSNYNQEDKKVINEFLIRQYEKLGYNNIRVIGDYNEVGYYSFFVYADIKSYNLSFKETTISCEIGQHILLDMASKSNEINEIVNKYEFASKNYEEDINNLVDSYNLTLTMAHKPKKFFINYSTDNKMSLTAKGKTIYDDNCFFFTKYFCYYDYLYIKNWLQQKMEENN